jgi:hypothetical protein
MHGAYNVKHAILYWRKAKHPVELLQKKNVKTSTKQNISTTVNPYPANVDNVVGSYQC